ncbi:hypothetical protein OG948_59100 (plasmid) [Embleya sp. NBC_00888]|uniref:hypothetical protein n=1 Tax=Embleya sp. NBC_00888 TaxID=2975960 RepID=UPI002F91A54A|nr:hypothetical protein OG948_59100 [Embleya sp. NBC_00888]
MAEEGLRVCEVRVESTTGERPITVRVAYTYGARVETGVIHAHHLTLAQAESLHARLGLHLAYPPPPPR